MSRVITFSRVFPSYHPRRGEPTHFVEKIWKSLGSIENKYKDPFYCEDFKKSIVWGYQLVDGTKYHTIRAGNRWKVGDWFSPRVWSGKPYNSKQIIIGPDIEIKKVWEFDAEGSDFYISGKREYATQGEGFDFSELEKNDGLGPTELFDWICLNPEFKRTNEFHGQVICWNSEINY